MSNRNMYAMNLAQLEDYANELASPFTTRICVCEAGTLAVWFKMTDPDILPQFLKTHVLADAYRLFIVYAQQTDLD